VRGQVRPDPATVLRVLVHQGWEEPDRPDGERRRDRLWDLQAEREVGPDLLLDARIRTRTTVALSVPALHPWLPPTARTQRARTVTSVRVTRSSGAWRCAVLVRTLVEETPEREGRRSLLALTARRRWGTGWILRGHAVTAWGDDVDLVSAVVPLDGLILSRHWGRWRSEAGGGVGRSGRGWSLEIAAGYRRAEPGRGEVGHPWVRAACGLSR